MTPTIRAIREAMEYEKAWADECRNTYKAGTTIIVSITDNKEPLEFIEAYTDDEPVVDDDGTVVHLFTYHDKDGGSVTEIHPVKYEDSQAKGNQS